MSHIKLLMFFVILGLTGACGDQSELNERSAGKGEKSAASSADEKSEARAGLVSIYDAANSETGYAYGAEEGYSCLGDTRFMEGSNRICNYHIYRYTTYDKVTKTGQVNLNVTESSTDGKYWGQIKVAAAYRRSDNVLTTNFRKSDVFTYLKMDVDGKSKYIDGGSGTPISVKGHVTEVISNGSCSGDTCTATDRFQSRMERETDLGIDVTAEGKAATDLKTGRPDPKSTSSGSGDLRYFPEWQMVSLNYGFLGSNRSSYTKYTLVNGHKKTKQARGPALVEYAVSDMTFAFSSVDAVGQTQNNDVEYRLSYDTTSPAPLRGMFSVTKAFMIKKGTFLEFPWPMTYYFTLADKWNLTSDHGKGTYTWMTLKDGRIYDTVAGRPEDPDKDGTCGPWTAMGSAVNAVMASIQADLALPMSVAWSQKESEAKNYDEKATDLIRTLKDMKFPNCTMAH